MNILLLQGPLGPFFRALSRELHQAGHRVCKVHFNAGDASWPCYGENLSFRGQPEGWEEYLQGILSERHIDTIVCYGDCRFYHAVARTLSQRLGIRFWALEEGYLRPDFITLEQGGVNAFSPLYPERDRLAIRDAFPPYQCDLVVGPTFARRAWYATRYHVAKALGADGYPHAVQHRPWSLWQEAMGWVRGGAIKWLSKGPDRRLMARLARHPGQIFLVPLQVSEDFQIREHADLGGIDEVITQIIESFACHGQGQDILLFKHHPMDRGYVSYRKQIEGLVKAQGLEGRVFYGYELPLPALYPLLKGVVTVNSTVGLSALLHSVPTLCLGRALYDLDGLTSRMSLAQFWERPSPVCSERFERLRLALLHLTQLNGSFYRHLGHSAPQIATRLVAEQGETSRQEAA